MPLTLLPVPFCVAVPKRDHVLVLPFHLAMPVAEMLALVESATAKKLPPTYTSVDESAAMALTKPPLVPFCAAVPSGTHVLVLPFHLAICLAEMLALMESATVANAPPTYTSVEESAAMAKTLL